MRYTCIKTTSITTKKFTSPMALLVLHCICNIGLKRKETRTATGTLHNSIIVAFSNYNIDILSRVMKSFTRDIATYVYHAFLAIAIVCLLVCLLHSLIALHEPRANCPELHRWITTLVILLRFRVTLGTFGQHWAENWQKWLQVKSLMARGNVKSSWRI